MIDNVIRHVFSCIITLLLIPVMIAAILGSTLRASLFAPQFYLTNLKRADAYTQIAPLAVEGLTSAIKKKTGGSLPGFINNDLAVILNNAFPPAWIETQASNMLTNALNFLNGRTDVLDIKIPIRDVKTKLAAQLKPDLRREVLMIPDELDLAPLFIQNPQMLIDARGYVSLLLSVVTALAFLAVFLALLLAAINLRHIKSALGWLGSGLFAAALPILGGSIAARAYAPGFIAQNLKFENISARTVPFLHTLAATMATALATKFMIAGVVLTAVAILFLAGAIAKRKAQI